MTRQEWEKQAEEYERKADEAADEDDELLYELYRRKAESSRFCAAYGTELLQPQEDDQC